MSVECISSAHHVARKAHDCTWCGESIEVGTEYLRERVKVEGDMQTQRMHLECDKALREAIRAQGGGSVYFTPGGHPRGQCNDEEIGDSL